MLRPRRRETLRLFKFSYSAHRLLCALINFDNPKPRIARRWKYNACLMGENNFHDQLILDVKQEYTMNLIGKNWWEVLKNRIRSFAADYNHQLT